VCRPSYVRDGDIEAYLRGLLWVVQMYQDGVCPDYSYTYAGRPAPTAGLILDYIERCARIRRSCGRNPFSCLLPRTVLVGAFSRPL
jgi:hypothetical protein